MRELSTVEVRQVSGGTPHIAAGALVGGVVGGVSYYTSMSNPTAGGLAMAVGGGALSGAFLGGAAFWGKKAASATFSTARRNIGIRSARFAGGFGASSFGAGMGVTQFGGGARGQACMGQGGGSY